MVSADALFVDPSTQAAKLRRQLDAVLGSELGERAWSDGLRLAKEWIETPAHKLDQRLAWVQTHSIAPANEPAHKYKARLREIRDAAHPAFVVADLQSCLGSDGLLHVYRSLTASMAMLPGAGRVYRRYVLNDVSVRRVASLAIAPLGAARELIEQYARSVKAAFDDFAAGSGLRTVLGVGAKVAAGLAAGFVGSRLVGHMMKGGRERRLHSLANAVGKALIKLRSRLAHLFEQARPRLVLLIEVLVTGPLLRAARDLRVLEQRVVDVHLTEGTWRTALTAAGRQRLGTWAMEQEKALDEAGRQGAWGAALATAEKAVLHLASDAARVGEVSSHGHPLCTFFNDRRSRTYDEVVRALRGHATLEQLAEIHRHWLFGTPFAWATPDVPGPSFIAARVLASSEVESAEPAERKSVQQVWSWFQQCSSWEAHGAPAPPFRKGDELVFRAAAALAKLPQASRSRELSSLERLRAARLISAEADALGVRRSRLVSELRGPAVRRLTGLTVGVATLLVTIGGAGWGVSELMEQSAPTPALQSAVYSPPPTARELAHVALEEGRHDAVCDYLLAEELPPFACEYLTRVTTGGSSELDLDALGAALSERGAAEITVRIVRRVPDDTTERRLETRHRGVRAVLERAAPADERPGRLTTWVYHLGVRDVPSSSRVVRPASYFLESPLWWMMQATRDSTTPSQTARNTLGTLIDNWPELHRNIVESKAGAAPVERVQRCARLCAGYRDCLSLGVGRGECEMDADRSCRACRDEGAHP